MPTASQNEPLKQEQSANQEAGRTPTTEMQSPATWSLETLRKNWSDHLTALARESNIPAKRLHAQMEQSTEYHEIVRKWDRITGPERLGAWKKMIEGSEKLTTDILPSCVQCGECCRKGSPTLHVDDLELLKEGKIAWESLVTLRKGEPVRSPFEDKLFFLLDERVKIRENPASQQCIFLDGETSLCTIYVDRPVQCRAQTCWSAEEATQLARQPYLTRRDIFRDAEPLTELLGQHDKRCSFGALQAAFNKLEETRGESIREVLDLLEYEGHFRSFLAEQLNIPENMMELTFGRSFEALLPLFGFKAVEEADGAKRLVPDEAAQKK